MTAYGRAEKETSKGRFIVEIQSVNRRHLEVNVNIPRFLVRHETAIRSEVSSKIGRGFVTVSVFWKNENETSLAVVPNLPLAKNLKKAMETIAFELGLEPAISLSTLFQQKELLIFEERSDSAEECKKNLSEVLSLAIDELALMKANEGSALAKELFGRLANLGALIEEIAHFSPIATEKYRLKLLERIREVCSAEIDTEDERILKEIALFAERVDITEELVRFKSHLSQFRSVMEKPYTSPNETRGKTLEFLLQELNREINTIGSKSQEKQVSTLVVESKTEIEKMREQIQNIE